MAERICQKGTVSTIEGAHDRNGNPTQARILPATADGVVTPPLIIPWWLRGDMGKLAPGVEVVYTQFEDSTGILISRTDGEWDGSLHGDVTIRKGDIRTDAVPSYHAHTHGYTHGGTASGDDTTGAPQ